MSDVIKLTQQLISYPSITPQDVGCQALLIEHLTRLGFSIHILPSGHVTNFWAQKGNSGPLFAFAGHTDVVATGNRDKWHSDPFKAKIRNGFLYGRGAADMKGSLAAMLIACELFYQNHTQASGSCGFLITSGEEGDDFLDGTPVLMDYLQQQNINIDYCIVGEPSSQQDIGDMIRIGRRGSLTGLATIHGKQGHVAYPQLAENPIHQTAPALTELSQRSWDQGDEYFPATTFQFTQIRVDNTANNVIPGELHLAFNFRFCPESTAEELKQQLEHCLQQHNLNYDIAWTLNGNPFLSQHGKLIAATQQAIQEECQRQPILSTGGGTSDGRFIAPYVKEIIELGPCNATIHQVNECVAVDELENLTDIYFNILNKLIA